MVDQSLLPVGSCVKLSNYSKNIMIAGYLPYDNQQKLMYDYIGIYTPIGIRKFRQNMCLNKDYICFKNDDIEKIIFLGFSDNKSEFYRKYLLEMKNNFDDMKVEMSPEILKKIFEDSLSNIKNIKSEVLLDER